MPEGMNQEMNGPTRRGTTLTARALYDGELRKGETVRALVFPRVFGAGEYVGQYSDNAASDIKRMLKKAGVTASSHVIDVGCGAAGPAAFMARTFGCRVTGVDVSETYLAAARERIAKEGLSALVKLVHGDVY